MSLAATCAAVPALGAGARPWGSPSLLLYEVA